MPALQDMLDALYGTTQTGQAGLAPPIATAPMAPAPAPVPATTYGTARTQPIPVNTFGTARTQPLSALGATGSDPVGNPSTAGAGNTHPMQFQMPDGSMQTVNVSQADLSGNASPQLQQVLKSGGKPLDAYGQPMTETPGVYGGSLWTDSGGNAMPLNVAAGFGWFPGQQQAMTNYYNAGWQPGQPALTNAPPLSPQANQSAQPGGTPAATAAPPGSPGTAGSPGGQPTPIGQDPSTTGTAGYLVQPFAQPFTPPSVPNPQPYTTPFNAPAVNAPQPWTGSFSFKPSDVPNDPGYQFMLQQGLNAQEASASAKGNLFSTGEQKDLTNYAEGAASTEFQQAYGNAYQNYLNQQQTFQQNQLQQYQAQEQNLQNQFNIWQGTGNQQNTAQGMLYGANANQYANYVNQYNLAQNQWWQNRQNVYNMLAPLAGMGEVATNQTGSYLGNYGNNVSNSMLSAGATTGSAGIAGANAWAGGFGNAANNAATFYGLSQLG